MAEYSKEVLEAVKRLQDARLSLMVHQPFYAILLLHMRFALDPMCETAYTDGERIAFSPEFMTRLSDSELEFVLMHEVMHVALAHCSRVKKQYDFDRYNIACDIVVNSNILQSLGNDLCKITLQNFGVSVHLAPDGKEGHLYTAEEVYAMLPEDNAESGGGITGKDGAGKDGAGEDGAGEDGAGEDGTGEGGDGKDGTGKDEAGGDGTGEDGAGKGRSGEDGICKNGTGKDGICKGESGGTGIGGRQDDGFDDHTYWPGGSQDGEDGEDFKEQEWQQRILQAAEIAEEIRIEQGCKACGPVPLCAQRLLQELTKPQTDWKTVLNDFLQEEVTDYSFSPPDRRFQDSSFLLPDYNEKDILPMDVLFMIDTSGSMSDAMITEVYSEVKGAMDQFDGKLCGWLGFFDACVVDPVEFTDEEELDIIRPRGGGGTSFSCIFEYVQEKMQGKLLQTIVILTDGYAPFPEESAAMDIPVLWLINNENVNPPWGKVTRIHTNAE